MKEEWRDVHDYEGYYQVSSLGRIRSLDRLVPHSRIGKKTQFVKGKILTPYPSNNNYMLIVLSKNGKISRNLLHRLVAVAFIEKPTGKDWINHIDNNPKNNKIVNLEWCTPKENTAHALELGSFIGMNAKPVWQLSLSGIRIKKWESQKEAAESLGNYKRKSDISACCRNVRRNALGYKWAFAE